MSCCSPERMGQDEMKEVEGEASQASRLPERPGLETTCSSPAGDSQGKGLPQAGAVPTLQGDKPCLPLASCREGKRPDLGCRGAN